MVDKSGEKKLGRGIASLLTMDEDFVSNIADQIGDNIKLSKNKLLELDINDISANPNQPRKMFDEVKLHELSESIKNNGLLQPIVVANDKNNKNKYLIIAGERRYRATKLAGLTKINAVILDVEEKEILKNAVIENVQREDLNPIEEANGYKKVIDAFGYTHQQLANEIGKSRAYITNVLRILSLPENVQSAIKNKNISLGHAKVLLSVGNPEDYLDEIIVKQLSVRQLEKWIETGSLEDKKKNNFNNEGNINSSEPDTESITFDMIKQLYDPLFNSDEQNNDQKIDIKKLKQRISNKTSEEWQRVQNNVKIIEEQLKQNCGFDVKLTLNYDGSGKIALSFGDANDLLEIIKLFQ